ncbi:MAG: hypothetical protein R2800_03285 [Flavipsychrobacter sp.]
MNITTKTLLPPLVIYILQDVSGSNKENGVVILTSQELEPYESIINRNVYLFFNVIDSNSAQRMVSIKLPMKTFTNPVLTIPEGVNPYEEEVLMKQYRLAKKQYKHDSSAYIADRNKRLQRFYNQVETFIAPYMKMVVNKKGDTVQAYAQHTDLVTAIQIADKAFTGLEDAELYLILNSDGFDSNHRVVNRLTHNVSLLVVNAHDKPTPALEKLIPIKFQSLSQAVTYSLTNKTSNYGY